MWQALIRPRLSLAATVAAALVVAAAVGFLPQSRGPVSALAAAADGADAPTITVSGEGEVKVKPDTAYLSLGVETQAPTAREAQQRNARAMNTILDRLQGLGLKKDDMQTAGVNLSPDYRYDGKGPHLIGYRASNTLRITVHELNRVGELLDAAVDAGVNQVQGVSFTVEDSAQARREALAKAVRDARDKADSMAGAAGVNIVRVRAVAEGGTSMPPVLMRQAKVEDAGTASAPTPVIPGDLTIRATVSVTFDIR